MFDPQVSYGEDLLFNYQYLEYAHTIACINESHYHYRILGSGTLSSKFRPKQFDTDYQQWKILQSFIKDIIYGHQRLRLICTNDCGVFYTMEFFSIHVCKIKNLLSTNYSCDTGNKKIERFYTMLFVQQLDQAVHSVSVISYILYLFFNHCQKMKLLLYPHGGSGNHGCEAIVRSTLK